MPPHSAATLRPRVYHKLLKHDAEPEHAHWAEFAVAWTALLVDAAFIVGSVGFLSHWPTYMHVAADWCFIIGSLVTVLLSLHAIHESHALERMDEMMQLTGDETQKLRNEFLEHMNFVLAGVIFFAGSLFYMPGIYGENAAAEAMGCRLGAYCFITGSFGFVMATFFSTIGMVTDPYHQNLQPGSVKTTCHYLHICGLACAQLGSVFFVVGSVLYRPVFSFGSSVAADSGTLYYVVGSILYTLQSALGLQIVYFKAKIEEGSASNAALGRSVSFP